MVEATTMEALEANKPFVLGPTSKSLLEEQNDHDDTLVGISPNRYAGCGWSRTSRASFICRQLDCNLFGVSNQGFIISST